jgi:hypothetical protein
MTRLRPRRPGRYATLAITVGGILLIGSGAAPGAADAQADAAALVKSWNTIPRQELEAAWHDAQRTGGVIVVEPEAGAVGAQAGQKKTWGLADRALKLVWGDAPNWFPVDLVRRTTCGSDARWSYFWHLLSGDEEDLHPWIGQASGFGHLLGPLHAASLVGSKALDLGPCTEVGGAAGPCLYGEVTPPDPFARWFCGGPRSDCKDRLASDPTRVPNEFGSPAELCLAGPWVLERVHAWRPEIHPSELIWTRAAPDRARWHFALIPDGSGRFDEEKHFARLGAAPPQPWSRSRAVEMWVAFASEPKKAMVLDLAQRRLRKKDGEATRTVTLAVPAEEQPFAALPHGLGDDLLAAVRSWKDPACDCTRGLVVLRARYPKKEKEALLLAVNGRRPDEPQPPAPFGAPAVAAAVERAPLVEPAVRLLAFTRVDPSAIGGANQSVNVMARFDARRPTQPKDEDLAEKSNKALAGKDGAREEYFGTRRPFTVHWTLEAFRESTGAKVPIVVPGRGRIAEGTDPAEVKVIPFRGKPTAEMTLNEGGPELIEKAAEDVVPLGQLLVTLPAGVVLKGTGRIDYVGPTPLELESPLVTFRVPRRRWANEWDLVRHILNEVDRAKADERLQALMADACHPLPSGCTLDGFNNAVAARIADPVARWATLREVQDPRRSVARLVRLFSGALLWDKWTDDDEQERLKRLLAAVYSPSGVTP